MEKKDAVAQTGRISRIVITVMAEKYPGVPHSIDYDVKKDRVVVHAGKEPSEFGPKEWHMSDQELRDLILSRLSRTMN